MLILLEINIFFDEVGFHVKHTKYYFLWKKHRCATDNPYILRYCEDDLVPIICQNGSGCDFHLIMNSLLISLKTVIFSV